MYQVSKKVNGHWDMWMFADLPITCTMANAATWKAANGYDHENETVYFPMAKGVDGKNYHLSVLAAANFLELLADNDGIPYHSASNTDAEVIESLYLGESDTALYDDEIINEYLNKNGIASAAFIGGRWAIWGAHAADYNPENADSVNVAETNRMMLYYVSNDFQARRPRDVDKPMTANDIASIVAEEQGRLNALIAMGALIYGEASLDAESIVDSDVYSGDFLFEFRVTTTPLAKSLKALVAWVDDGYSTYFANGESDIG
jgi:phage tail sheath protein FI